MTAFAGSDEAKGDVGDGQSAKAKEGNVQHSLVRDRLDKGLDDLREDLSANTSPGDLGRIPGHASFPLCTVLLGDGDSDIRVTVVLNVLFPTSLNFLREIMSVVIDLALDILLDREDKT